MAELLTQQGEYLVAPRSTAKPASTVKHGAAAARTPSKSSNKAGSQDKTETGLIAEMKQQHRDVEALITKPDAETDLRSIVEQVAEKWIPHTLIEEQIILPAIEHAGADEPALAEATVRRDLVKLLLADLTQNPEGPQAAAKFAVLSSEMESLIAVEEKPEDGVLALAETHNVDLDALKPQVDQRMSDLKSNTEGERDNALEPTSLRLMSSRQDRNKEYSSMPNDSNTRERDEYGRFTSDDDRGRSSRSSRDYDDDYRRSGSNGGGPGRDEEGRFTSGGSRSSRDYDDDRRGGRNEGRGWYGDSRGHSEAAREGWDERRGSSRYDDDDDRRGGRGHGGWFGDSRGHAEAAREGWDERRGGGQARSSRDYDDDRRGGGGGRGHGGWFGDPEGHSEAAREGWDERRGGGQSRSSRDYDDDRRSGGNDRGQGGWFGDSRGHSEAAREGWDERRGGGQSRSSRDYDDDRRSSSGRGHGGWFGDPQGHSEASREGWEHRR